VVILWLVPALLVTLVIAVYAALKGSAEFEEAERRMKALEALQRQHNTNPVVPRQAKRG